MSKIVRVAATNREVELLGSWSYDQLLPFWSYSVPGARYSQRYKPGWDGRIKLLHKDGTLPAGLFRATRKEVEDALSIRFKVKSKLETVDTREGISSDREYQNACAEAMLSAIPKGGGIILNATGTGKTFIAALLASKVKCNVCFIVDQLDLLEQARNEIQTLLGKRVGYVGKSIYEPRRVTVATVQTIHRHVGDDDFQDWFDSVDILLIDELHVQMSKRNFKAVQTIQPKAVFGLTATLEMKKKPVRLRAYAIAGPVIYEYGLARGTAENVLSQGVVVRVRYENRIED